jgi:cobalt-zinc-cadmium efflux system outer membrane protein
LATSRLCSVNSGGLLCVRASVCAAQTATSSQQKRIVTLSDAVSIFLQQNLDLIAARYDVDSVEAEKLSAAVRPNPAVAFGSEGLPLGFNGSFLSSQTFTYNISQDFELGKKRAKRITAANANSELARAQFQAAVWQLTNDVKKKFYAVLLAQALLNLSKENQTTFDDIVQRTREVFRSGEISGLDLQRVEIEKFKFDTDVANSERDYELAVRDLRLVLGGDYRTTEIETAGSIEFIQQYDFSLDDLRTKALAARPDLKVAQVAELAADAAIRLQGRAEDSRSDALGRSQPGPGRRRKQLHIRRWFQSSGF